MQTLGYVSLLSPEILTKWRIAGIWKEWKLETYKNPNRNTRLTPIFCFFGSCNARIPGMGSRTTTKSVKMLRLAFKNHNTALGKHHPSTCPCNQYFGMG
jgi:hypothetical protein